MVTPEAFKTETYQLNLGPQHPSTHGVYRSLVTLDGERVVAVENIMGYLHRGMEKLAESKTYGQFIPYTDRLDYLAPVLNNWGYVLTVEKLCGLTVPERAEFMRVILGELQRIASHIVYLASFILDFNGYTPWMYLFRERERVLDLLEGYCGSRMTTTAMRIGGVPAPFQPGFAEETMRFLDDLPATLRELDRLVTGNEIFRSRTVNIGIIDRAACIDYGISGPNLRAAGVARDLRRDQPYSVYDRFDFTVVTAEHGDCYDRFLVRIGEIEQSAAIIRQALAMLPAAGDLTAKVPKVLRPPQGEVYGQIEGAKGWLGFYIVSDGGDKPYRLHIHGPSLMALGAFPVAAKGGFLQDLIAVLASIDIVMGEVDR